MASNCRFMNIFQQTSNMCTHLCCTESKNPLVNGLDENSIYDLAQHIILLSSMKMIILISVETQTQPKVTGLFPRAECNNGQ